MLCLLPRMRPQSTPNVIRPLVALKDFPTGDFTMLSLLVKLEWSPLLLPRWPFIFIKSSTKTIDKTCKIVLGVAELTTKVCRTKVQQNLGLYPFGFQRANKSKLMAVYATKVDPAREPEELEAVCRVNTQFLLYSILASLLSLWGQGGCDCYFYFW